MVSLHGGKRKKRRLFDVEMKEKWSMKLLQVEAISVWSKGIIAAMVGSWKRK